MHTPARAWLAYAFIFVLALGLRLGYQSLVPNSGLENLDSPAYEDLAAKIAHHQPYQTDQNGGPGGFPADLQRPPGYPAFLATINFANSATTAINQRPTSITQCLLGSAFATLLAWFVAKLANPWIGLLAGGFYATDWVTIVYTPMIVSETVYTVMLGTAVLIYALALGRDRKSLYLIAGLLLGISALVKPAAQVVVLAFLLAWLFRKPRRWSGLLFLVTYMACVLPWMIRNETRHGVLTLSEIGTVDLYLYNAHGSLHSYPVGDLAGKQVDADAAAASRIWEVQSLAPSERSQEMRHQALALIAAHWPAVLRQSTIGFVRSSLGTASVTAATSMNLSPDRTSRILLNALPMAETILLWGFAIVGCFAADQFRLEIRVLLAASVLCVLLPAASPLAQSRFRVPAVPEICILAAAGVAAVGSIYSNGRRRFGINDSLHGATLPSHPAD